MYYHIAIFFIVKRSNNQKFISCPTGNNVTFRFPFFTIVIIPISYWLGKQYDMVKYLSENDSLTKIYNRRYIIHTFPQLSVLVDKKDGKLSLFLIDIDQFKIINDTYGHEMGDRVLQQLCGMKYGWLGNEP